MHAHGVREVFHDENAVPLGVRALHEIKQRARIRQRSWWSTASSLLEERWLVGRVVGWRRGRDNHRVPGVFPKIAAHGELPEDFTLLGPRLDCEGWIALVANCVNHLASLLEQLSRMCQVASHSIHCQGYGLIPNKPTRESVHGVGQVALRSRQIHIGLAPHLIDSVCWQSFVRSIGDVDPWCIVERIARSGPEWCFHISSSEDAREGTFAQSIHR
mmetsp:Transcript_64952/g.171885  ORF Transcript_64952/g.171885 Transcript_64952/m.171885 type:complete len:216 (-) Transcript_64952:226-873(-)